MTAGLPTNYDQVLYPSALYEQTHPDRLATLATLFGMQPAAVAGSRVLELGCGDGGNLIAMAVGLPESEFVGIDLAQRPIQQGQAISAALGLTNVTLRQLDLLEFPATLGEFDFIVAHGLYSWVPAPARDQILAICGRHLRPHGVAYVSYNAYPGNHLRDMVRWIMRYHAAHFVGPEQQVSQARALLKFLAESQPEPDVYHRVLRQQLERVLTYNDAAFFHDDLSPVNHPVYFQEFADHAARYGLEYLAEADYSEMQPGQYPPEVLAALQQLDSADVIATQQYLDFLRGRAFRQTLLCRRGLAHDRAAQPTRLAALFVAGEIRPQSKKPMVASLARESFQGPKGAEIETSRPLVKAAFLHLGATWPRYHQFPELLAAARDRLGPDSIGADVGSGSDAAELGEALLRAYAVDFVELHAHRPPFLTAVSERPKASPLARLQLERGNVVSTLRHTALKIEDDLGRRLVMLLDGTRDRAALLAALSELVKSGVVTVPHKGKTVTDVRKALQILDDELGHNLANLARAAVLVA